MVPRGFLFFFPRSPAAAGALFFGAIKMKAGRTEGGRAEEREKGKSARGRIRDKAKAKMQEENDSLNPKRGHGGPIYRPRGGGGRRQYPADSAVGPPRRPRRTYPTVGTTAPNLHLPPRAPLAAHHGKLRFSSWAEPNHSCSPLSRSTSHVKLAKRSRRLETLFFHDAGKGLLLGEVKT